MAKLQAVTGPADLQQFVAHNHDATEGERLLASAQRRASSLAGRLSHSVVAVVKSKAASGSVLLREMEARCKTLCSVRMPCVAKPNYVATQVT